MSKLNTDKKLSSIHHLLFWQIPEGVNTFASHYTFNFFFLNQEQQAIFGIKNFYKDPKRSRTGRISWLQYIKYTHYPVRKENNNNNKKIASMRL